MMLDADTIRTARGEAARSGRQVLDILEERSGLRAGALVAGLAGALGYRAATMAELERAASAFDVLPYADAARRGARRSASPAAASRSPSATPSPPTCAPGRRSASPSPSNGCSCIRPISRCICRATRRACTPWTARSRRPRRSPRAKARSTTCRSCRSARTRIRS